MSEYPPEQQENEYLYTALLESQRDTERLTVELTAACAELAALRAEQGTPLDRPDKPGWWWFRLEKQHPWTAMEAVIYDGELCVDEGCNEFNPAKYYHVGEWLPAAPPRDLREGGE